MYRYSYLRHCSVLLLTCILQCCVLGSAGAKTIHAANVVRVIDGDSIIVKKGVKDIEVRLWGIDTPEYDQAFAREAKNKAKAILLGQVVDIIIKDRDIYGREVALVRLQNGELANELLVKGGYAWVYTYYCQEPVCSQWKRYEQDARKQRLGLWNEANPVAPWIWKRKKRLKKK